jgi:hypothetical protein
MPDDPQNDEEIVETHTGTLPPATPAPDDIENARFEIPEISEEDVLRRQAAISTRRRPDGPPLEPGPSEDREPEDVPETEVSDAVNRDTD